MNQMTPLERRLTGRYPIAVSVKAEAARENLRRMGYIGTPHDYLQERIANLKKELSEREQEDAKIEEGTKKKVISEQGVALQFRINNLEETVRASAGERVRPGVRWTRFFFLAEYLHSISGEYQHAIAPGDTLLVTITEPSDKAQNSSPRWLVSYNLGFYDSDALSAYVYGTIKIPIE